MPVLSIVNPKGGSGKSTLALVVATTLAERGLRVVILDGDINLPIRRWAEKRAAGPVQVIADVTDDTIVDIVHRERTRQDFVLIDTEGVAGVMATRAVALSDLVLIPLQPSALDAAQATKAILMVRAEERIRGRVIPARAVLTRTSPSVPTRRTKQIVRELEANGVHALRSQLHGRVAYENLFYERATLTELDQAKVAGVPEAIANAATLVDEIVATLRRMKEERAVA
jgi:chromosome partitioning protein